MAAAALAHGPWALLNSAELMRQLLTDLHDALVAESQRETNPQASHLFGVYTARDPKPTHNRPLPLPDALLQGTDLPCLDDKINLDWIQAVIDSPWLWKLQWTTLVVLFVSPALRSILMAHCPEPVATKWLRPLESRLHIKLVGASIEDGFPGPTASKTPLMTVTSEMILLRMTYEL